MLSSLPLLVLCCAVLFSGCVGFCCLFDFVTSAYLFWQRESSQWAKYSPLRPNCGGYMGSLFQKLCCFWLICMGLIWYWALSPLSALIPACPSFMLFLRDGDQVGLWAPGFLKKLRCNWHVTLYLVSVSNTMIWYMDILWNDHHNKFS